MCPAATVRGAAGPAADLTDADALNTGMDP